MLGVWEECWVQCLFVLLVSSMNSTPLKLGNKTLGINESVGTLWQKRWQALGDQGASLLWGIFFKSDMLGFSVELREGSGTWLFGSFEQFFFSGKLLGQLKKLAEEVACQYFLHLQYKVNSGFGHWHYIDCIYCWDAHNCSHNIPRWEMIQSELKVHRINSVATL